jgi:hypothetical protein
MYNSMLRSEERSDYSSTSRLVEILREENSSLKQELETYYQRVRKLQKVSVDKFAICKIEQLLHFANDNHPAKLCTALLVAASCKVYDTTQ